ncbi:hypothetical protein GOBAR_DD28107 [Gossypium barbadense]|nr:hypothetical protein GOBAR_DD28107 [Gossypium barbadense]
MEWCPLNESDIKMNFDAAFDVPQAKSVSAVVARNASREILVPKTVAHRDVASPFTVEAHACLQAVLLGKQMGYALVIIEGDMHQSANLMAHELVREAMRDGLQTYLIGRLPEHNALEVGSRRRREPD